MMGSNYSRRTVFSGMLGGAALFALPGCAGLGQSGLGGFSLTEAVRRLLTVASQNAFAELTAPNGFLDSQVAKLPVPAQLGGPKLAGLTSALLSSPDIRTRLQRQFNRAAEKGAERAAPLVADTIRMMSISDAARIVSGGGSLATDLLERRMGSSLIEAMAPGIGEGLRLFDDEIVRLLLSRVGGLDMTGLSNDVAGLASDAVYAAIGAEEARIRANPSATGDPLLIGVFGLAGRQTDFRRPTG